MANPIFTQLNSNFTYKDSLLAIKLIKGLFTGKEPKNAVLSVEARFSKKHQAQAVMFSSGRGAEYAIFKALNLPSAGEVIVQPFTCVAAINPIIWNNLKPVYSDIDLNSLCLDPKLLENKITQNTKALLCQHTFGNSPNYSELVRIAKKHNLQIIQDCAHTLEADLVGEAAFFSFGNGKVISGVWGGVVVTKNKELAEKLKKIRDQGATPGFFWQLRSLLYPLLMPYSSKLYQYNFTLGKIFHKLIKPLFIKPVMKNEKASLKPPFINYKPSEYLAQLVLDQLDRYSQQAEHTKVLIAEYNKHLAGSGTLVYNILHNNAQEIVKQAEKQRVFLGCWYSNIIDPKGVSLEAVGYKKGSCPNAEQAARESVNLPLHKDLSVEQVKQVIGSLDL